MPRAMTPLAAMRTLLKSFVWVRALAAGSCPHPCADFEHHLHDEEDKFLPKLAKEVTGARGQGGTGGARSIQAARFACGAQCVVRPWGPRPVAAEALVLAEGLASLARPAPLPPFLLPLCAEEELRELTAPFVRAKTHAHLQPTKRE